MKIFVARQPIFDVYGKLYAYEILYRNNDKNMFPDIDGDTATTEVIINSFLNIGIEELSNGYPCFINFTENLLKLRLPTYFNPRDVVIEILENVIPSKEIVDKVKELKELGYRIALDDYVFKEDSLYSTELLELSDIVKIDFMNTTSKDREYIENFAKKGEVKLLAEKIETLEEYTIAKSKGYHFFQGYYFSKPIIISGHDIPVTQLSYYGLINKLSLIEPDIDLISQHIEQDLSLSYKLLKLINSPAYRPVNKISSIKQAIVLLGLIEIQKWVYVLAFRDNKKAKTEGYLETLKLSFTRAKFCELIAQRMRKQNSSSYFLTGMFSLMETLLSMQIDKILQALPLNENISDALRGKDNEFKQVLDLVQSIETSNWENASRISHILSITEQEITNLYKDSIKWSEEVLSQNS